MLESLPTRPFIATVYRIGLSPLPRAGHYGYRFAAAGLVRGYYACDLETCLAEVGQHLKPVRLTPKLQKYAVDVKIARLLDLTGGVARREMQMQSLLNSDDYGPSINFGARCRSRGIQAILHVSVRRPKGMCLVLFDPSAVVSFREI